MWYVCPWCCQGIPSDFPVQYIHNGILVNMENWVRDGTPPPHGAIIQTDASGVVRDANGNALGGVRTPYVDVPVKRYSPYSGFCPTCPNTPGLCGYNPTTICGSCSNWCVILGNVAPFDETKLENLYKNHGGYVSKFVKNTQQLFKNGWVTEADMEIMKTKAAESDVLK